MKVTNVHNVPKPLVTLAEKQYYSKGKADYSVTELMSPARVRRLRDKHDKAMTQDVSEMMWSMLGSALHVVMERGATDNWISEERLFAEVDGVTISGGIDLQEVTDEGVIIYDYKFTSAWAVMNAKIDWTQQLNIYKWLVEHAKKRKVIGLKICSFIRDFSRHDTGRENYPQSPIHMIDIPMWGNVEIEEYIRGRLNEHRDSKVSADLGDPLPPCTPEEQWFSETTYAVRREGRKTAIRVLKDLNEANEMAVKEKGYVETRLGEPRRCTGNFCGVAEFCDQYKLFQAGFSDPV
jgi:PD-(D/E)XK nuclease superfamily